MCRHCRYLLPCALDEGEWRCGLCRLTFELLREVRTRTILSEEDSWAFISALAEAREILLLAAATRPRPSQAAGRDREGA